MLPFVTFTLLKKIKMKNVLFIVLTFSITFLTAQSTAAGGEFAGSGEASKFVKAGQNGFATTFFNPKRPVDGTNYLFDDWSNFCEIITADNKRYGVKNVNLNIERNTFEAKFSGDSLFVFNFNNIKKFVINNKTYKNYFWDDDNRVYQVVYEAKDFSIIKGFKITEVVGSANPMLGRSRDRLVRKEFIYLRTEEGIKHYALNKRKILKLFSDDKSKQQKLQEYVKKNNLSYKKESDVTKMLDYVLSI